MKKLIIGAALLAFAGCASYGDTTKSQQLGENIHRVSMRGNALNNTNDAQDFALLKAAETTIDSGYRYFIVTNAEDRTKHTSYTEPSRATSNTYVSGTANTTGNIYGNQYQGTTNLYGNSTTSTTYTPGQTYNFTKPGVDVMIRTFSEPPSAPHFDALEITKYLGVKLNPKRWAAKE